MLALFRGFRVPTQDRNISVDIAKGIGIIFVVLGHNWIVFHDKNELFRIIYSFHVPLFFFLSGLFFKKGENFKVVFASKFDSILKPYFVVLFFVGVFRCLFDNVSFFDYLLGVFYATGETIAWVPMWFLPLLFISLIVSNYILKISSVFDCEFCAVLLFVIFIFAMNVYSMGGFWRDEGRLDLFGVYIGHQNHLPGLPFSFDLIGVGSAYLLLGYLFRNKVKAFSFNFSGFVISLCAFSLLHFIFDETIDLNQREYGNIFISTAQAALGIYLVVSVSSFIAARLAFGKYIAYIGSGSLFVLIFHSVLQGKAFSFFSRIFESGYLSGWLALISAVFVSMLFYEMALRINVFAMALLPQKRSLLRSC